MSDRILFTTTIVSLLLAVIIAFFIISIIRYNRQYICLQRERIRAEITMQEQERKRIANDLHDSLGPLLSTVKIYMNSIDVVHEDDRQLMAKASGYVDETIRGLREISYNLLPNSLDRNGLVKAVKEYIYRITAKHVLKIEFTAAEDLNIPKESEIHLFRIVQEIIQNTLKHAQAKTLHLYIGREPELIIVSEDDGLGFDLEQTRIISGGLGLKSMESRCEMVNANFQIITEKEKGCKIIIKLPV
ncbi:MAG: sensor histidine kinase [Sphingobacteriaceae bacterium]|nr:MAG: sensor histidine kinase [Sphingobacteriaceae bacterium]